MCPEESIEIENGFARNRDRRTRGVVSLLAVGNDDIESVDGAALKNSDENFLPFRRGRIGHLHEDVGKEAARDERESGGFEEEPSVDHFSALRGSRFTVLGS